MTDKPKSKISEEKEKKELEVERLLDFDRIPGFADVLSGMLRDIYEVPSVEVTNAFEWKEQFEKIPEEERRTKFFANFLVKWDPAQLDLIYNTFHCAVAINRHDDFEAGDRFTSADRCEPLPWFWVTGEPNTDRRRTVSSILAMCSKRSVDRSGLVDCELDEEAVVAEILFGSYFDHTPGDEIVC